MFRCNSLRAWARVLFVLGVLSTVLVSLGLGVWAVDAESPWITAGIVLIGLPVVLLFATWPFALSEALRALADIGETFSFDSFVRAPERDRTKL